MKEPLIWIIIGSVASSIIATKFGLDAEVRRHLLLEYGHVAIPAAGLIIAMAAWLLIRMNRSYGRK